MSYYIVLYVACVYVYICPAVFPTCLKHIISTLFDIQGLISQMKPPINHLCKPQASPLSFY